jgi:hypothetical protein
MANQEFFDQAAFDAALEEDKDNETLTTTQEDARTEKSLGDTEWNLDNGIALVRSAGEGLTYNLSIPVGLAGAAAWAKIFNPEITEDYSTIYKKMRDDYARSQEKAEEQIGGLMTTAELGGGILSPLPFAKAGLVGRTATSAGLGGVSSALEETTVENAMEAGAKGALISGAATGVLGAGGKALNFFTKRSIETDLLNEDGSFKPIFLAPQTDGLTGGVQKIYRNVLGNAPVSGRILREQQEATIDPARRLVEETKAAANETQREALDAIKEDLKAVREAGRSEAALTQDNINTLIGKGPTSAVSAKTAQTVREATDAVNFTFRKLAFMGAAPTNVDPKVFKEIEDLILENPRGAVFLLDSQWREKGFTPFFNSIPDTAQISRGNILTAFNDKVNEDSTLVSALKEGKVNRSLGAIFEDMFAGGAVRGMPLDRKAITGRRAATMSGAPVTGSDIGSAYARLGTLISNESDPATRSVYYKAQETLVDLLEQNLPKNEFRKFIQEKKKWKTLLAVRDATESTGFDIDVRGKWGAENWLTSVDRLGKTNARYGKGPLVNEAEGVVDTIRASERPITNAIRASFATRVKAMEDRLKQAKAENERLIKQKQKELANAKRSMPWDPGSAERAGAAMSALEKANEKLFIANKTLEDFNNLKIAEMPSFIQEMAAFNLMKSGFVTFTGTSGAATAFGASLPQAALAGLATVGGLRGMASPRTQRVIAGQTGAQQAIQRGINSQGGQMVKQILGSNLPIVTAGMLTGEQQ